MTDNHRRIGIALQIQYPYPHHQQVLTGVLEYCAQQPGWEGVIDEHPGLKIAGKPESHRHYDGVIARADETLIKRMKRMEIPLVNTWLQQMRPDRPGVYADMKQVGRIAADHLISRGFRRLSFEYDPNRINLRMVRKGIEQAVAESEVELTVFDSFTATYENANDWRRIIQHFDRWLDTIEPPAGLLIESPMDVRMLVNLCRERGWRVPTDIAIICQMEFAPLSENISPQMSTVDINYEQVGYEAAALLYQVMEGEPAASKPLYIPPLCVIGRETTDYFAVEDKVVSDALTYISEHLRGNLSVEIISEAVNVSPRYLQTRFDEALGRPISEEIRRLRLEVAKRLLGDKAYSIAEVAKQSGFSTNNLLSRVFQRELGMSPSAYRKKLMS